MLSGSTLLKMKKWKINTVGVNAKLCTEVTLKIRLFIEGLPFEMNLSYSSRDLLDVKSWLDDFLKAHFSMLEEI